MDKVTVDMINALYRAMDVGELPRKDIARQVLAMTFVEEYLVAFQDVLTDDDIRNVNRLLDCIYNRNCLACGRKYVTRSDIENGLLFEKSPLGEDYGLQVFDGLFIDTFDGARVVSILNPKRTLNFGDFNYTDTPDNNTMIVGYNSSTRQEIQFPADIYRLLWGIY